MCVYYLMKISNRVGRSILFIFIPRHTLVSGIMLYLSVSVRQSVLTISDR